MTCKVTVMPRKPTTRKRASKKGVKAAADRAERKSNGKEVKAKTSVLDRPETKPPTRTPSKRGRKTLYRKDYAHIARSMCDLGATDHQLAIAFGVTTTTIWRWQSRHKEFGDAVKVGKEACDDRVERALYQKAVGYTYNSEKIIAYEGVPTRVPIVEHVPPDTAAGKHWLLNRRPKDWSAGQVLKHAGHDGGELFKEAATELDIARRIAFTLARAAAVDAEAEPIGPVTS
jgi:hypothetical protein